LRGHTVPGVELHHACIGREAPSLVRTHLNFYPPRNYVTSASINNTQGQRD